MQGDIGNLKAFSKRFRDALPVDYYKVFCELERALTNELDFLAEAQAMEKASARGCWSPLDAGWAHAWTLPTHAHTDQPTN